MNNTNNINRFNFIQKGMKESTATINNYFSKLNELNANPQIQDKLISFEITPVNTKDINTGSWELELAECKLYFPFY